MAKGTQQPMRGAAPREVPRASGLAFPALKIRIRHVAGLLLAVLVAWGVFAGASVIQDQPIPRPHWSVSAVEFDQVLFVDFMINGSIAGNFISSKGVSH